MSQSNSISVHRKMNQTGDFTSVENSTSFLYPTFGHDDWNNNSEWKSKRNKVKEGAIYIHEIIYFLKTFTVFFYSWWWWYSITGFEKDNLFNLLWACSEGRNPWNLPKIIPSPFPLKTTSPSTSKEKKKIIEAVRNFYIIIFLYFVKLN